MIKYLRINAVDGLELGIRDLIIDLETNKMLSGFIDEFEDYKMISTVSIEDYAKEHNGIWAKVVDNGRYDLLNENNEIVSSVQGYVPEWVDARYNCNEGFGDYIDFEISKDCFINTHDDIMNVNELFNLMIAEAISAESNYSKEAVLKNLGRLQIIRDKLKDPYYTEKIDKGIEILKNELKQWED